MSANTQQTTHDGFDAEPNAENVSDRFEPEKADRIPEGVVVEHPIRGKHYEITRDAMFSVEMKEVETGKEITVDKRDFSWDNYQVEETP